MKRFVQFHYLTSYPAVLLNRDDAGMAKRVSYGGVVRTRISSQCLKRHWRAWPGDGSLRMVVGDEDMSVRSRATFDKLLYRPLLDAGYDEPAARTVTVAIRDKVLKKKENGNRKKQKEGKELHTGQVTVLGRPEVTYLLGLAKELLGEPPGKARDVEEAKAATEELLKRHKKNLAELGVGAGLDAALFGRMVTSDILARCDAAVHVAHAFTVHEEEVEVDYFSAVDDLLVDEDELGSGHIGSMELTSGVYYGYVVVDLPLLVENLSRDSDLAAKVVAALAGLIARVSPGAKLGSTAPYGYALAFVTEVGNEAPRSFASAFLDPVPSEPGMLKKALEKLATHVQQLDAVYPSEGLRRAVFGLGVEGLRDALRAEGGITSLPEVQSWLGEQVAKA